jgi:hypothetical protein
VKYFQAFHKTVSSGRRFPQIHPAKRHKKTGAALEKPGERNRNRCGRRILVEQAWLTLDDIAFFIEAQDYGGAATNSRSPVPSIRHCPCSLKPGKAPNLNHRVRVPWHM